MAGKWSLKKKLGVSLAVLLGLFVITAVAVPLLVDVDQFRPQIVQAANSQLNGELKVGKLRLSLWGQLKVQVDGMSLTDSKGRTVVSVADVYLNMPLWSLVTGAPAVTLNLRKPQLFVVKDSAGINLLSLPKDGTAAPSARTNSPGSALPGFVASARLGMRITDAKLVYADRVADLSTTVSDLQLRVKDLSLTRTMELEVGAALDAKLGKTLQARGPGLAKIQAKPQVEGGKLKGVQLSLSSDFSAVSLAYAPYFQKKPAEPMNVNGSLWVTPQSARIDEISARLQEVLVTTKGVVDWSGVGQLKLETVLQAPQNEVRIGAQVDSFAVPKIGMRIASSGLDIDKLMTSLKVAQPTSAAATAPAATATSKISASTAASTNPADYDSLVSPLREIPALARASADIDVDIRFVQYLGARMEPVNSRFKLKNLVASVESFKTKLFDGAIAASFAIDFKPKQPRYDFATSVSGFDLKKAVTSQAALFKNTVYGKAAFQIKGNGMSLNPEVAKSKLHAVGNFVVAPAQFATIDVAKMVADSLNGSLGKIAAQVPGLGQKKLSLGSNQTDYEKMSGNFTIQDGVFRMPDLNALAVRDKGIDVRGDTTITLKDYGLSARWFLVDTYNLTGAKTVSVEASGVRVENVLAEPGQPVKIPVVVGGTLFAPQPDYTAAPEALIQVALGNIGRAAGAKAKSELAKKAKEEIEKAAPALKNVLKGLKF